MEPHELSPLVEALLFAAAEPVTVNALVKAVDDEGTGPAEVRAVLDVLAEHYEVQPRGFRLVKLGNGFQIVTRERYAPWVEAMVAGKRKTRLSRAALETAAVIAYKQPITRLDVERIRGVDAGAVLNTLLERSLIMIKGRDPGPGRPLLYGTTQEFLDYFGLAKVTDLPRLDEIAALARSEAPAMWDESERARFEKHGVEPDTVPAPGDEDEGTAIPEDGDAAPDAEGEALPAGEAAAADAEAGDYREDDREEFRRVVSELAGAGETPEDSDPAPEDAAPAGPEDAAPAGPEDGDDDAGTGESVPPPS
jgi:segregation and condensation protein B